jgi:hypothetical protein
VLRPDWVQQTIEMVVEARQHMSDSESRKKRYINSNFQEVEYIISNR